MLVYEEADDGMFLGIGPLGIGRFIEPSAFSRPADITAIVAANADVGVAVANFFPRRRSRLRPSPPSRTSSSRMPSSAPVTPFWRGSAAAIFARSLDDVVLFASNAEENVRGMRAASGVVLSGVEVYGDNSQHRRIQR